MTEGVRKDVYGARKVSYSVRKVSDEELPCACWHTALNKLLAAHCSQHTVHCKLHTSQCKLLTALTAQCTLHDEPISDSSLLPISEAP